MASRTNIKARDGHGRAIRTVEQIQADRRAAEMRSTSMTYDQIADQLQVSKTTAFEMVKRGFADIPNEGNPQAKSTEVAKLDRQERLLWAALSKATRPADVASLSNARIQVARRRAALCGLDEPAKTRIEVVTEDVIDRELRELAAEVGMTDRLAEVGLDAEPVGTDG